MLLRILRLGNLVESARGQTGGYKLTRPPENIIISDVIDVLGGRLFKEGFCDDYTGAITPARLILVLIL